jgi:hypothetical protein
MSPNKPLIIVGNGYDSVQKAPRNAPIMWTRTELNTLMSVYGRAVAAGEWRDYGLSSFADKAVFAIFRKAHEIPLYRVEKLPELRRKQGQFRILAMNNQVLRRGHDLKALLRAIEPKRLRLAQ